MSGTVNHGYILSTTKRYREIIPDHIGVPVDPLVAGVVHRFAVGGWGGGEARGWSANRFSATKMRESRGPSGRLSITLLDWPLTL